MLLHALTRTDSSAERETTSRPRARCRETSKNGPPPPEQRDPAQPLSPAKGRNVARCGHDCRGSAKTRQLRTSRAQPQELPSSDKASASQRLGSESDCASADVGCNAGCGRKTEFTERRKRGSAVPGASSMVRRCEARGKASRFLRLADPTPQFPLRSHRLHRPQARCLQRLRVGRRGRAAASSSRSTPTRRRRLLIPRRPEQG